MGCGCSICAPREPPLAAANTPSADVRSSQAACQPPARGDAAPGGAKWPCEARLLFVRHAQAEAKSGRQGASRKDPDLSPEGYRQAQLLGERLRKAEAENGLVVICSPMRRCLHTAAPVGERGGALLEGRRAVCHAWFCEHGNSPEDFSGDQIARSFPKLFGTEARHEVALLGFGAGAMASAHSASGAGGGGDTPARAVAAAAWLQEECGQRPAGAAYAIFSHQTFLDALLQVLLHSTTSQWEYGAPMFRFQNTAVTELRIGPSGAQVVYKNDSSHLR